MGFNSNGSAPIEEEDDDEEYGELDCDGDGVGDPETNDACWKAVSKTNYDENGEVFYSGC